MFLIRTFIWIASFTIVLTDFTCPELDPHCTCGTQSDWWDIEWTDLTFVNCSFSNLKKIPNLSSLKGTTFHRLYLNNNRITEVARHNFRNLSVKEIVLRKNPIRKFAPDAFADLRDILERLDVDSNRIKIDDGLPFLQGLYKLKYLDLGYNSIVNKYKLFPPNLFSGLNLTSLTTLTLQALKMSQLENGSFVGIEHLEQLDLSHNYLPDFPKEIRTLKNLKGLKLYSNELEVLKNNSFLGLTKLKKLLVGVNDMDVIETGAFNDLEDSVEEINFYHNPLGRVPTEALDGLWNLKKLSLVKTSLKSIKNGSFEGEYKLTELHLDNNPNLVFNDEGMFYGIEDSLEVLSIRALNLVKLPLNVLKRLDSLYYLDVTDNDIRRIDKHFFNGVNQLTDVRLSWNKIKHVDHRAFRDFPKGVSLDLYQNQIHNISFILDVIPCTFNEVHLSQNPIQCDCNVEKVLNSGLVVWDVTGECYVEDEHINKQWYNFNDPQLMDYFDTVCTMTTPYSTCMQSVSGTSTLHMCVETNCICLYVIAFLIVSYLS